ncbi:MAG: response regulator transcription factor, partial [Gammaproteobacteria bacterium]|nr:response regulator transcription factor [Gammaproteobacteria bacterium]
MRVIIIDDHALFRDGLKGLLEQRSIDVAGVAADGKEGIELAKQIQPDIILLDLRMPNMGGLDTLPILRKELPTTPVVMLTTSNDESDLIKAL